MIDSKKIKVMTVVGTRPEIIRLSCVIKALDLYTDHVLVHTGQNYDYELNKIFFDELKLREPDYFLNAAGKNTAETVGQIITKIDEVLESESPDAFLILGDTNSCLSAYSAKRRKIPIFHMEAGNRCFDQRVPEEINRRIVDGLADINLPYSSISREYLLKEGFPADRIIKIGSPMFEVLNHYKSEIESSNILNRLLLKNNEYFVVSCHREENVDNPVQLVNLISILNNLVIKYNKPVIFSAHPRTQKRLSQSKVKLKSEIKLMKPFGFFDYIKLQKNAKVVLSDSGTIMEESSILGFPALNIRDTHERPEGMEEASVIMTGLDWNKVNQSLELLELEYKDGKRVQLLAKDYSIPNVSYKIIRIIFSYINYINENIWKKR